MKVLRFDRQKTYKTVGNAELRFKSVFLPVLDTTFLSCDKMQLKVLFFLALSATIAVCLDENPHLSEKTEKISRQKRSVILLPSNTSITITFDLSMPVQALATQSAFYNMV